MRSGMRIEIFLLDMNCHLYIVRASGNCGSYVGEKYHPNGYEAQMF